MVNNTRLGNMGKLGMNRAVTNNSEGYELRGTDQVWEDLRSIFMRLILPSFDYRVLSVDLILLRGSADPRIWFLSQSTTVQSLSDHVTMYTAMKRAKLFFKRLR
jgi:hypothetical protein